MISFKKNIIYNYISQIYITIIGIILIPRYIEYMGAEAYGLVGFYAMLQGWFALLDFGLTPAIARETARFNGGAIEVISFCRLFKVLEWLFFTVALIGGCLMFFASEYIVNNWLKFSHLNIDEVKASIKIIALIISFRLLCGLYRSVISGSERIIGLSILNSIIATLRFVGIIPVLIYVDASTVFFFSFQLIISIFELIVLIIFAYRLIPKVSNHQYIAWDFNYLKSIIKFALTIAFTAIVWVLITQTDKLILSKIMPLSEYGGYTIATLVAGGVLIISSPIASVIMARLTKLEAEKKYSELIVKYRQCTQLVVIISSATSLTMAFNAEALLWSWTGNIQLSHQAAPILTLYSLGNGILAITSFPYYLQYAKGDLKLHFIGNIVFVLVLIPSIILAAIYFGAKGAGLVWLMLNFFILIFWIPFIHIKFMPGLNIKWLRNDISIIVITSIIVCLIFKLTLPSINDRLIQFALLILMGVIALFCNTFSSSFARQSLLIWLQKNK